MPIGTCQRAVFVAAAICAAMGAAAADSATIAPHSYRLILANADHFRLAQRDGYAPVPAPGKGSDAAIPANLAAMPFAAEIQSAARQAALDPALVHALIHVESRHNPVARSPKGALGLMQLLPETASRYGVTDPMRSVEENLRAGTRYLRDLMNLFDSRIDLVLAAYNAGENAVMRHGQKIPPYRETRQYVPAVLEKYREWQEPPPIEPQVPLRVAYMPGTQLDPIVQSQGRRP